jgi:hypothetical protein
MAAKPKKHVVVCTEHRGVFYGQVVSDSTPEKIVLAGARNCVYWSTDVRGVLGLASSGPTKNCKIGPAIPEMTVFKVTAILDCTPESVAAWEKSPWS